MENSDNSVSSTPSSFRQPKQIHQRIRKLKDKAARYAIALGGISVIITIVLIFFYLLYVVMPMFSGARIHPVATYSTGDNAGKNRSHSLYIAMEEQAEIALKVTDKGDIEFFKTTDGKLINKENLALEGNTITSIAASEVNQSVLALGLSNGHALVIKHEYKVTYNDDDTRVISPFITYPMGEQSIELDEQQKKILKLAIQEGEDAIVMAAATEDKRLTLITFTKESSMLADKVNFEREQTELLYPESNIDFLLIDKEKRVLYTASKEGRVTVYDISEPTEPEIIESILVTQSSETTITTFDFLAGDISLLIGTSNGKISQWFPVRDKSNKEQLAKVRSFQSESGITKVSPEYFRKGFFVANTKGEIVIYHTTANRTLLTSSVTDNKINQLAVSPRGNALLVQDDSGTFHFYSVENEHPEISWSALWGKVWYESYQEPDYVWQSSSASNDFEPKFSLIPITFGTIKAAFYAMLIAIPVSIMGAIFTAHFMAPRMRSVVKPSIEIMEALPTVILGFLAGLWLAPILENHLPGIFTFLLIAPLGILIFAFMWQQLPHQIKMFIPDGWQAALLIPVIIALGFVSFSVSPLIEQFFFGGDVRSWLSNEMGIPFDQRNSLVVGLAMGFAVIPTIFSITEDAIFSVPKHLVNGSLALGATQWQTLLKVVLLTASPGIFSAVMIGFGRAVGETMIVLMATGNTPVMDFSIFQGMRTLAANIAVEMPESEVDSTHYRVLFLAALVLFVFTFFFNTIAEIIRQRLRTKYSSL
ncbi:MAG: ABC transporter permease subunit [Gammaproteobacteria bacterium]|nr:ABC transporter permease subunit [Gammaproteobacteria bacterium]